eukprot:ANDGO_07576.mRNA.1 hypothetical protein
MAPSCVSNDDAPQSMVRGDVVAVDELQIVARQHLLAVQSDLSRLRRRVVELSAQMEHVTECLEDSERQLNRMWYLSFVSLGIALVTAARVFLWRRA